MSTTVHKSEQRIFYGEETWEPAVYYGWHITTTSLSISCEHFGSANVREAWQRRVRELLPESVSDYDAEVIAAATLVWAFGSSETEHNVGFEMVSSRIGDLELDLFDELHIFEEKDGVASKCEECSSGHFSSGVPGVLAHIAEGIILSEVHRCDACQRYESDAEAERVLRDRLGIPSSQPSPPMITWVCKKCRSDDVVRDAFAKWSVAEQKWLLDDTYDMDYCRYCGGETELVQEPAPESA